MDRAGDHRVKRNMINPRLKETALCCPGCGHRIVFTKMWHHIQDNMCSCMCNSNMQTTFEGRLETWKQMMRNKFYLRQARHPGETSATNDNFDWKGQTQFLEELEQHLIDEVCEYFGLTSVERGMIFERLMRHHNGTKRDVMELVDISNLSFVTGQAVMESHIDSD